MFIARNIGQLDSVYPQILDEDKDEARELFGMRAIYFHLTKALTASPRLINGDVFAYLDYVQRNVPRLLSEEDEQNTDLPKCNARAEKARKEGNRLYLKEEFFEALEKYNESICWAQSDSEDLALGYANRSAVYYEMKEYEFALANIALAKKHNYPERLMPKLQTRELNCKTRIGTREPEILCSELPLNTEMNPKIPFVAKGIAMKELPRFGRSMVSEKDFNVGDVILSEKATMVSIGPQGTYEFCQYCSSKNVSLIPCSRCVSAMYCSEECLAKGWKESHRFECGICDRISSVPFDECRMAAKMFFYGLTLFNDDLKKMMKYCKSHKRNGSNPFGLDYTKASPLDAFKVFHTAKIQPREDYLANGHRYIAAILYTIYIQQPLVRSLFVSQAQKNFLLKHIEDYLSVVNRLFISWAPGRMGVLYTVASVCNHSCYPNTHAMYLSGQLKFAVIRPISKGEQICISYGPIRFEQSDPERYRHLSTLEIDCACEVCDPNLLQKSLPKKKSYPPSLYKDFTILPAVLLDDKSTHADNHNAVRKFIQRYASYAYDHPLDMVQQMQALYREDLTRIFAMELMTMMREKAYASIN